MSNPELPADERERLVKSLMRARRAVGTARQAGDSKAEAEAHAAVDEVKRTLGERGPVWWDDKAPDLNRYLAKNTIYATWLAGIE